MRSTDRQTVQILALIWLGWMLLIAVLTVAAVQAPELPQVVILSPLERASPAAIRLFTRTPQPSPPPNARLSLDTQGAAGAALLPPLFTPTPPVVDTAPPSLSPALAIPLAGLPIRIEIPALDINAAVELIGLTTENEMAAPAAWDTVGWYQYGYRPGELGNAVFAGHLDTDTGAPGIFWQLDELKPGDSILIETNQGKLLFQIETLVSYPYDQAPVEEIFGATDIPSLSLITCSGTWNRDIKIYDHRLVVYARLIQEQSSNHPKPHYPA